MAPIKNNFITEIIAAGILITLVLLLLNPFTWWMPDQMVMMLILALLIVFAVFAGLVWKEKARDERELLHRTSSGRVAFLSGICVLVIGIAVEGYAHSVDFWLVLTLAVMLFAKIATSIYNNLNN